MNGLQHLQAGEPRKALPLLMKAARKEATFEAFLHLAAAQRGCGLLDEAVESLFTCMKMNPDSAEVWNNLAQVATDQGKWEDAGGAFARALQIVEAQKAKMSTPAVQNIMLGFAYNLMRMGNFKQAWPLWEYARYGNTWHTLPGVPRWTGEPCKSLLVVCEGGYGDAMLFSRWLPEAAKRCESLSLLIWDEMITWCDWSALGVSETVYCQGKVVSASAKAIRGVLPLSTGISATCYDAMTSWMSFPAIFGMDTMPPCGRPEILFGPLVESDPNDPSIGFCWRAEESGMLRKIRSLDEYTVLKVAKELNRHGLVYSLCPNGKHIHRPGVVKVPAGIRHDEEWMKDWKATTELMAGLDYVVTVDTAIAHLAGILRIPTLLLLPLRSDWKWGLEGTSPPWYPTVRFFRNKPATTWDIDGIRAAISELVESK